MVFLILKNMVLIFGSMLIGGVFIVVLYVRLMLVDVVVLVVEQQCKVLFWYDLMYLNICFDKLGKLLFMDMDLVLKYVDEESVVVGVLGVCIDLMQIQNFGVKIVVVICGLLCYVQIFLVNISYNEYQYVIMQVWVVGFINKVYLLIVGDKVK